MRLYELSCEMPAILPEESLKSFIEEISGFISKEGKIEKINEPIKRRLAYPIKSNREVFLINISFELNPEKIEHLEKKLKADENIIRHIIVIKPKEKESFKKNREKKEIKEEIPENNPENNIENSPENKDQQEIEKETKKSKKVELKEIDQKIEEILNE